MSSLYDTLGVPPDASTEDIKDAYRKRASETHPDKDGGDVAAFQMVAIAHAVLMDPVRRDFYDATGDSETPPIDIRASRIMLEIIGEAIDTEQENIVAFTRMAINRLRMAHLSERHEAEDLIERLTARSGKVKVSDGANLVQQAIDARIELARERIEVLDESIEVASHAYKLIAQYTEEVPVARDGLFSDFSGRYR